MLPPPPIDLFDDAAIFLDFDGTLVPLTDVPEAVRVDPPLLELLTDLRDALDGRLAIVSGRSVATLRDLFGLHDFILAGTHGLEFAAPGSAVSAPPRLSAVDAAERVFDAFAADKPGLLVERKTLSIGLHFRRAPQWAEACRTIAQAVSMDTGLYLQPGKMLYELRPGGADKGTAVARLIADGPMGGSRPIFFGDDVTDEEGFLAAVQHGGCGILVGAPRVTIAQWHLEQVASVRHYLTEGMVRRTNARSI
jgi:trehalose 6-phosphate phosphatase